MFKLQLPRKVDFACPLCNVGFTVGRDLLHQREYLYCPGCGGRFAVFDGLTGRLRQRVYSAIRNHLEGRIYEQQQLDHEQYFEDLGNL